jgi:hypothetical protein
MDKEEEDEEANDLEEEVMIALTSRPVDRMKQTRQPVTLTVAI